MTRRAALLALAERCEHPKITFVEPLAGGGGWCFCPACQLRGRWCDTALAAVASFKRAAALRALAAQEDGK